MTRAVPGPHPSPRRPRLAVPPGACDCHNHVFGPHHLYPMVAGRAYTPPEAPLETFLALLDHLGVERAVIVQPSVYGTDNSCTAEAVARMGERARGVAVADASADVAALEAFREKGFRGLRFNLVQTGGSTGLDALETLAARAADAGLHVQLYLRGRHLPEIEARLLSLPVPLVVDHMGHLEADDGPDQPGARSLLRLLEAGRAFVKLIPYRYDHGGHPWRQAGALARRLAAARPDALLWGTDWPHPDLPEPAPGVAGTMPDDGDLVDALGEWFGDGAMVERILVDNPARLYGFPPAAADGGPAADVTRGE